MAENVMDGKKKNIEICNSRMDHGYIEHMIDPDCIAKKRQNANLEHTASSQESNPTSPYTTGIPSNVHDRLPAPLRTEYSTVTLFSSKQRHSIV